MTQFAPEPPPTKKEGMSSGAVVAIIAGCVFLLVVVCGGASLGVLLPALSKARQSARMQRSQAQLRQIGTALYAYAQNNDGAYPEPGADLKARLGNLVTASRGRDAWTAPGAGPGVTSYYYVPHDPKDDSATTIILYEDPSLNSGQGGSIVYADLHIDYLLQPKYSETIDAIKLKNGTPWTPHKAGWVMPTK